ncbi:MAG: CBS domain-containing protein [Nanoarchaeota archaeon]
MKTGIKVSQAMTRNPVFIGPNESLPSCARKMLINNVGGILVVENFKLLGIVTEKDIVEDAVAKELNIKKLKVKDIMTTGMITISPDVDLEKAISLINREDVRRLPVIKNNALVGILTIKDIIRAEPKYIPLIKKEFLIKGKKRKA